MTDQVITQENPVTVSTNPELVNTPLTRESIMALGNRVRLSDSDPDAGLDLYCYNRCTNDDCRLVRDCRGIIFNGTNIVLKGFPYTYEFADDNTQKLSELLGNDWSSYKFYEAHEGALLRVFNWKEKWYVTTHRKMDAFRSKWSSKESFGQMFKKAVEFLYTTDNSHLKEILGSDTEDVYTSFINNLNKSYQYMFLVRNNYENRIVCQPPTNPMIYHVGTFVDNGKVLNLSVDTGIPYPAKYEFRNITEISDFVRENKFDNIQGIIIFTPDNIQYKLMNTEYKELFCARGNEPSVKYRYLQIRMDKKMSDMLYFLYPRYADTFDDYENTLYDAAKQINTNYIQRFIKKKYVTVPKEEYTVMNACHEWHLQDRVRNRISLRKVIEILNEQPPTNLNKIIRRMKNQTEETSPQKTFRPRARSDADKYKPKEILGEENS